MYKKFIFSSLFVLCNIFILRQAPFVLAKTLDEYADNAYQFIEQGRFDEALTVIREGLKEYPGNIGLVFALAETYHNKKDYETAVTNYLSILSAIRLQGQGKEAPGQLHHNLVDAYNEIGQKHYFSEELCLRIIYHAEKVFELTPEAQNDKQYMEFLRKSLGHYEVAKMGVKMMETGGDSAEFQLPSDNINLEEKLHYKDKAVQRLKNYDASTSPLHQTELADKTLEEIIRILADDVAKINSIHYRKIIFDSTGKTKFGEIYYKHPDKFKQQNENKIAIVNNKILYIIDTDAQKVIQEMDVKTTYSSRLDYFSDLHKINLPSDAYKDYDFEIRKLIEVPETLKDLYKSARFPNLYLVIGKAKEEALLNLVKIEFVIDTDLDLVVNMKGYVLGILGSGREEELANETTVKKVQKAMENLYLPKEVTFTKIIEEYGHEKGVDTIEYEIISLNEEIDDMEFSVSKYGR